MIKTIGWVPCALSVAGAFLSAPALADDPRDPTMRSEAARARDRAIIRQMNQEQLVYVRDRDADILKNRDQANRTAHRAYDEARADYERRMETWRDAVSACRAGRLKYCGN